MTRVSYFSLLFVALFCGATQTYASTTMRGSSRFVVDPVVDDAVWVPKSFRGLSYRILMPIHFDPQTSYPLVVFLHGSGESGTDNQVQIRNGVEKFASSKYRSRFAAIVIAPQCPDDEDSWGGYAYDNKPTETQARVIQLTRALIGELPIDEDRVYLMGVSMGAIGTWDIIARYPHLFAAAIPVAGAGDPQNFSILLNFPIWAFHGELDENVDPEDDETMFSLIHSAGGLMKYTEYKGVGHNSWDQTFSNPKVIEWLFEQKRNH